MLQKLRSQQDCGDGFPMDEGELDGEPIDLSTRQHGRIVFSFQVFETWWDGGPIVCPCVRTAFAGDIYNAVEMAKQAPEERVLSFLHYKTLYSSSDFDWEQALASYLGTTSAGAVGEPKRRHQLGLLGPRPWTSNRICEDLNQNMHLRHQDITPGGWKEKQTVNRQVLTLLEH